MSTETEGQHAVQQSEDMRVEPSGKPSRSYTIEFLLSLRELEVCKKLPNGFDESLLSEFEDTCYGIHQRVAGSSSLQGFRRTDYGSPVPSRGDSASYSRGIHRWDSRSSGRSDTDSDSEAGRHYGSQPRRSGQNSGHDGLLGSGSFPRPTGYAASASVPRFRPNGNLPLNRSNEPYHPPRPYKAVPHTRRETNDSYNDETFGSTDSTSEDRVEEEKKRRAEFELMRKEQQKALQEKQKSSSGKLEDPFSNIVGLREHPNDSKTSSDSDKVLKQAPQDDSDKLPLHSQAPPPRPLVPPGFVNSVVDKGSSAKSIVQGDSSEVGKSGMENSHQEMISVTHSLSTNETQGETISLSALKHKKLVDSSSIVGAGDTMKGSRLPDVNEVLENGQILALDSEVTGHKLLSEPGRSTSILEKLFGNTLTASSGSISNSVEGHDAKTDDIWSPNTLQSKFAGWFLEEDRKPLEDISSEKPSDLLSLIVGGEKGGSDLPDIKMMGPILPAGAMLGHMTPELAHSTAEMPSRLPNSNGPEPKPAVLTCEDLEQSILSEVGGNSSNCQPGGDETSALDAKVSAEVDNQASHHLLSLLQKGMGSKNVKSTSNVEGVSFDKGCDHEFGKVDVINDNTSNGNADRLKSSEKTLTLEALFGTAFMKELHSAQKNSESTRVDVPEPLSLPSSFADGAPFSSTRNDIGSGLGSLDVDISSSRDGIAKLKGGRWLGIHDSVEEAGFSKPPAEIDPRFNSIEGRIEAGLPEEDILIRSLGDPINHQNSMLPPNSASYNKNFLSSSSSNTPNVMEKLAVLGAALRDERSMIRGQDPLFLRDPYEMVKPEIPYQNLHQQASSPRLHAAQMNPGRPLFHALDSHPTHLDPHLKFMPPDASMHNQLPTNMGHHPPHRSAGLPGFDPLFPPPVLQHMAGSLAPPQLLRGFPSGAPMPPHPGHNPAGYIPDHNPMQGFPFGQRQPQFGGPVMGSPGADLGGADNPPDAFQRLLEMELRANPKQTHPNPFAASGGHSRPMYGHELDMGFQYR